MRSLRRCSYTEYYSADSLVNQADETRSGTDIHVRQALVENTFIHGSGKGFGPSKKSRS